jgi:hypothetical protein
MGWFSSYKIYLNEEITDFDYERVKEWTDKQGKYIEINYKDYYLPSPLIVYVTIKYGTHEILDVIDMLKDIFNVKWCEIRVESTDELEWTDRRDYYDSD